MLFYLPPLRRQAAKERLNSLECAGLAALWSAATLSQRRKLTACVTKSGHYLLAPHYLLARPLDPWDYDKRQLGVLALLISNRQMSH